MDNIKIGKFIRKLREEKGFTQDELANMLGVDRTFVSRWERGITLPDVIYLKELAKVFNISFDELIEGKSASKPRVDDATKKAIRYYENRNVKRILCIIIVLLLLVSAVTITACVVDEHTYFVIDELHLKKDDIEINGYFISNKEKSYLLINDIFFVDMYVGTVNELKISEAEIILQSDKRELMKKNVKIVNDQSNEISKVFSELNMFYKSNQKKLDKLSLSLIVNYKDVDGILKTTKISLDE